MNYVVSDGLDWNILAFFLCILQQRGCCGESKGGSDFMSFLKIQLSVPIDYDLYVFKRKKEKGSFNMYHMILFMSFRKFVQTRA